eukprot:6616564-Alexandrium_andersonii.AAC.1
MDFYDSLATFWDAMEKKGVPVLLGDFNARISSLTIEDVVGPHHLVAYPHQGEDEGEDNASLLITFCQARDLVLPLTWKRRANKDMVTFRAPGVEGLPGPAPDPAKYAELDLVITPRRWDSVVKKGKPNVRSPLPSDHYPLHLTLG